jgi:2,3-bisphosphoglycerate-independent phosphoglycerate mutase
MSAKIFYFSLTGGIMTGMERVIFIFVDGCGIGRRADGNPFFLGKCRHLPFWQGGLPLPDGTPVAAIDATLGIPGAPQSASGQTALFCGIGADAIGRRHRNGYPDRHLRRLIRERNLLSRLVEKGMTARFLNAYPAHQELFTRRHARIQADGRLWFSCDFPEHFKKMISVTSCMLLASGQKPFGEREIRAGRALYQDYSNRQLIEKDLSLPRFTPQDAARVIHGASRRFDFILYEYFQTDLYAHRKPLAECVNLVRDLDTLVGELLALLDGKSDTLVLTSDHGNLEEFHLRGHSRNPVPLIAWGRHGARLRKKIKSIRDVAPAILELY